MLKDLMTEACMTQTTLSTLSDVSQQMISDLQRGNRRPSLEVARAITEALAFALKRPLSVDDVFPPITETPIDGESHD